MSEKAIEKVEHLPKTNCDNCNYNYEGFFCPRCGQRKLKARFTLKMSIGWIFDQIFNLERGIFYTIKELTVNPGKTIENYFKGATIRYMHPFRFVFLLATISSLITILTGTFESPEVLEAFKSTGETDIDQLKLYQQQIETVKKYLSFIVLLNIPFYSVASLIVYNKKKHNFTEHLILNCYAFGFTLFITLPTYIALFLPNGFYIQGTLNYLTYILGYAWVFSRFFKENFFISILKMILMTIVTILMVLIFLVIVFLVGYALGRINF